MSIQSVAVGTSWVGCCNNHIVKSLSDPYAVAICLSQEVALCFAEWEERCLTPLSLTLTLVSSHGGGRW